MLNLYAGTSLSVYIMPINKYIYILKSPMSESHEIGKRMGNKTESGTWIFFLFAPILCLTTSATSGHILPWYYQTTLMCKRALRG